MRINEVIERKYSDLAGFCTKNVIQRIERQHVTVKDVEDIDLLHTFLIKFLKKYKDVEFDSLDAGYQIIKTEFLGEKKFQKMIRPNSLQYVELTIKNDSIDDNN